MELDFDACYSAISSRDRRFDGRFFTGVLSTRIYCRPICPARTPLKRNVTFYRLAAAAEAAGFRPCRRCRPEASPDTPDWNTRSDLVRRAVALIDDGILDGGSVAALASALHHSERHLRRVFRVETGTTPIAFARHRRLQRARLLIDKTTMPLTEVAWASGYTSIRQFNDQIREMFGSAPSTLRREPTTTVRHRADLSLRLPLKTPLDRAGLLSFLSSHLIPGVETMTDGRYSRVGRFPSGTAVLEAGFSPNSDALILKPRVTEGDPLPEIIEGVRSLFDLNADPQSIDRVLASDELLRKSVRQRPGMRVPGAFDPFEIAVRTIIGQQVSIAGANTITGRLVRGYGAPISSGAPGLSHSFPTAEVLAGAPLTGLGLTTARMNTIRGLARAVVEGNVNLQRSATIEELNTQLLSLKGIGPWTASYIAMRVPQDPDAFLGGDLGVKKAFTRLGGTGDIERWSLRWRPWRSYAVMHLWASL